MFQVKGIILGPDYFLRKHAIYNRHIFFCKPFPVLKYQAINIKKQGFW